MKNTSLTTLQILFFLLIFANSHSFACINAESKMIADMYTLYFESESKYIPYGYEFVLAKPQYEEVHRKLDSLHEATGDYKYLSDKGLLWILEKEYDRALNLYFQIEKASPGRYSTASNLGTLYELMGENENALKWIQKSIEINPESHRGSEWLHVNILKAKIKGDSSVINSDFLLGVNFGSQAMPKANLTDKEIERLIEVLYFQLNERRSFIKGNDPVMAQLFFDMGNLYLMKKNYYVANRLFEIAINYGLEIALLYNRLAISSEQIAIATTDEAKKVLGIIPKDKNINQWPIYAIGIAGILAIILVLILFWRNYKRKHEL